MRVLSSYECVEYQNTAGVLASVFAVLSAVMECGGSQLFWGAHVALQEE